MLVGVELSSKFRIFRWVRMDFGRKYEVRNGSVINFGEPWFEVRFFGGNKFKIRLKFDLSKVLGGSSKFGKLRVRLNTTLIIYIFCFHKKRILFKLNFLSTISSFFELNVWWTEKTLYTKFCVFCVKAYFFLILIIIIF